MINRATSLRRVAFPWVQRPLLVRPMGRAMLRAVTTESQLGYLPLISMIGAFGLLLVSLGDTAGRLRLPGDQLLFWLGYGALIIPFVVRLLGRAAARPERLGLLLLLGLGMYLVKILNAPASFAMFDEFHHWATLDDILTTGRLFTHNNILPASPFYPGLEITADPLVRAGASIWEAGALIIGAARVLMVLTLFLFFERAGVSARLAGVATLIYMANPSFLFFDAQFGYESLGLPLAMFVVVCVLRRQRGPAVDIVPLTITLLIGLAAVTVTHHVTALLLCFLLIGWSGVSLIVRGLRARDARHDLGADGDAGPGMFGPALIALTATIAWILYWASITIGYLAPAVGSAVSQVVELIAGEETGRVLFKSATGGSAPLWDQAVGYGSVALLLLGMAIGGLKLWRIGRRNTAMALLGTIALLYPATLVARVSVLGAELSARSSEFVFVGLGFVVALAALAVMDHPRLARRGLLLTSAAVATIFLGGMVLGYPYWARVPGPYLVSADPRSITLQGVTTATWMRDNLGIENRVLTDRISRILTKTYGRQHPISAVGDRINVKPAYFATDLSEEMRLLLKVARVRYVLADRRLPSSLPYTGVYVERGEVRNGAWTAPLPVQSVTKWNGITGVDRIYDDGVLQLYDLRVLLNVR